MSAIIFYFIAIIAIAILCALCFLAAHLYKKALDLNPDKETRDSLKQQIKVLQEQNAQESNNLKQKQGELADANLAIQKAEETRKYLKDNENTLNNLKGQISSFRNEQKEVLDELNRRKQDKQELDTEFQKKQEKLTEANTQYTIRKAELDDLETKCRANKILLASLNAKVSELESIIVQKQRVHDDKDASIKSLAEKERQLKDALTKLEAEKETFEKRCAQITDDINTKDTELDRLNQKFIDKEDELKKKNNELQELKAQIKTSSAMMSEFESTMARKQRLYDDKDASIKRLTEKEHQLKDALTRIEAEKEMLEKRRSQIIDDIHSKDTELAKLNQRIIDKADELGNKNAELQGLKAQIETSKIQVEETKNQWDDLEHPWPETPIVIKSAPTNEQKWLEHFQENLKKHNILFNERTIRAFHTGLKVTDISPIVILAGVSGTGKSLLPQLYAHALGMNFLNIAVQPRWDSPQDMLGFYNFMEKRFKATALSRLLWQYDVNNNKDVKKKYSKGVPMNMVLLDEMNLARVEYYFSDLLSKLEVRRSIDWKDKKQLAAASICLECGSQEQTDHSRYLLPGYNTFFVGTMNEDETTQSLSDKVMDRANVLRFGKPSKLDVKTDIEGFLKEYETGCICLGTGKTTIWEAGRNDGSKLLSDIMNPINEALAKIGRPFAHRVWQAMEKYVSMYPLTGEKGLHEAIADQLEMKILPKLNGLEKERPEVRNVLAKVREGMSELHDDELTIAFESALNADGMFFQWHGVGR